MSSIIVNFPDCADDPGYETARENPTITITTKGCSSGPPGPPPVISWWESLVIGIVLLAAVVCIGVVRHRAHELKPRKLEEKRLARKQEIDGQIELARAHKQCLTCGKNFEPELS